MPSVAGEEIFVYFEAAAPALPDWWQFKNAGTCRLLALTLGRGRAAPDQLASPGFTVPASRSGW